MEEPLETGSGPSACLSWPCCCPGHEPQGATGIPQHMCNSCSPTAVLRTQGCIQQGASWQQVQHPVGGNAWAPTRPHSWLGANTAESGLLTPFVLIGNGNPSSALHSLGDGGLSQLLLQAPPAARLQEGGWGETERELLLGARRWHCPCTRAQPHHETNTNLQGSSLQAPVSGPCRPGWCWGAAGRSGGRRGG